MIQNDDINDENPIVRFKRTMATRCPCRPNRKRFLIIVSLMAILTFLTILAVDPSGDFLSDLVFHYDRYLYYRDKGRASEYTIDTVGCRIPYLNPMDWSVIPYVNFDPPQLPCGLHVKQLSTIESDRLVVDLSSLKDFSDIPPDLYPVRCCYQAITRDDAQKRHADDSIIYSDCVHINQTRTPISSEFIRVTCFQNDTLIYTNFHSIAHIKPHVESRCQQRRHQSHHAKNPKWSLFSNPKWPPINVLFLGLDAVSRLNAYRHLNDVIGVLRSHTDFFDMAGFNKIGDNTLPNVLAMLTGRTLDEEQDHCLHKQSHADGCNFIWKNYSRMGYRTIYGEDAPWMATFNYLHRGFNSQPTDYYLRPLLLAAATEFLWYERGNIRLCMGNYTQPYYSLKWLRQVLTVLDDEELSRPSFAVLWLTSMTHDYLNDARYVEQPVAKFFNDGFNSGIFRNTVIFFLSDHGQRYGPIRQTYIGHMEERLPALFIALPKWFRKRYPKSHAALGRNTKRMVNPLDVYATMAHLMDPYKVDEQSVDPPTNIRSLSLFSDIPEKRTCADIGIAEHFCACHDSQAMSIDDPRVSRAAHEVLKTVNELTNPYRYQCANVSIQKIVSALVNTPRYANSPAHRGRSNGVQGETVTVIIETEPGKGRFEGTVSFRNLTNSTPITSGLKLQTQIVGPISRINLYKYDSQCVDDPILKKYCLCIKQN